MKLGSETNSFINNIYSRMTINAPTPEIGMGATFLSWTDRDAGTVVSWNEKTGIVGVTHDTSKRVDKNGMSKSQEYEFTSNMDGPPTYFKKNKHGEWVCIVKNNATGRWVIRKGGGLILGMRDKYYDYSF